MVSWQERLRGLFLFQLARGAHQANEEQARVSGQKGGEAESVRVGSSRTTLGITKAKYSIRENHVSRDLLGK